MLRSHQQQKPGKKSGILIILRIKQCTNICLSFEGSKHQARLGFPWDPVVLQSWSAVCRPQQSHQPQEPQGVHVTRRQGHIRGGNNDERGVQRGVGLQMSQMFSPTADLKVLVSFD